MSYFRVVWDLRKLTLASLAFSQLRSSLGNVGERAAQHAALSLLCTVFHVERSYRSRVAGDSPSLNEHVPIYDCTTCEKALVQQQRSHGFTPPSRNSKCGASQRGSDSRVEGRMGSPPLPQTAAHRSGLATVERRTLGSQFTTAHHYKILEHSALGYGCCSWARRSWSRLRASRIGCPRLCKAWPATMFGQRKAEETTK